MQDIEFAIKIIVIVVVLRFAVYGLSAIIRAERNAGKDSNKRNGD